MKITFLASLALVLLALWTPADAASRRRYDSVDIQLSIPGQPRWDQSYQPLAQFMYSAEHPLVATHGVWPTVQSACFDLSRDKPPAWFPNSTAIRVTVSAMTDANGKVLFAPLPKDSAWMGSSNDAYYSVTVERITQVGQTLETTGPCTRAHAVITRANTHALLFARGQRPPVLTIDGGPLGEVTLRIRMQYRPKTYGPIDPW